MINADAKDDTRDRVSVERAIAEFRAGRPVVIRHGETVVLAAGVEDLDEAGWARDNGRLVLTGPRLTRLGADRSDPGVVSLPQFDRARIELLALAVQARLDAPVSRTDEADRAALELTRLAWLAPAALVFRLGSHETPADTLAVSADAVLGYRAAQTRALRVVSRAPVPLEGAPDTEFVVFRGGEGLRDQVAVVVGRPDFSRPMAVRLHSACLTGDLFGSLTCDCGDQLRGAVQVMAASGGGVLLYLDQEGRGNGFANKMRAYRLQGAGHDTYEADSILGFGLDGRGFDFAAAMLKLLGVTQVRLMTNNPAKIEALSRAGLEIIEIVPTLGRPTVQNARYLAAKREKAGHLFEP